MESVDDRSLWHALTHRGIFLILFAGLVLIFSGLFVFVQSFTGHFLPHDVAFLGMDAEQLGKYNPNIVKFMFHDRVAFGGVLIALGLLYVWLAEFPLRSAQAWAWWLLLASTVMGFASFLCYLGYGYLDSYHGAGTLALFPFFVGGIYHSYDPRFLKKHSVHTLFKRTMILPIGTGAGFGYALLQVVAVGIFLAGLTIMTVGMTTVFVPQDLDFMCMSVSKLRAFSDKLIPLIAHDRAGFGGGLATIGFLLFFIIRCAAPSKHLYEILLLSISIGFLAAIGIHFMVGYTDFSHLAPAYTGVSLFAVGIGLVSHSHYLQQHVARN